MSWFVLAIKKYAVFQGRARRKEYWYFVLFFLIFSVVLGLIDGLLGMVHEPTGTGLLSSLLGVALLLPSIAVSVRRLHDIDRSGWWYLLWLLPVVGWIVLVVWAIRDGEPGENRFGANPKEAAET